MERSKWRYYHYCILLWMSYVFFWHSEIIAFPTMATELPIFVKTDIVSGSPSSFCWLDPSIPHMALYDKTCTPPRSSPSKSSLFLLLKTSEDRISSIYIYYIYIHVYFTDHISSTSIYIYIYILYPIIAHPLYIYILYPLHIQCYHKI